MSYWPTKMEDWGFTKGFTRVLLKFKAGKKLTWREACFLADSMQDILQAKKPGPIDEGVWDQFFGMLMYHLELTEMGAYVDDDVTKASPNPEEVPPA